MKPVIVNGHCTVHRGHCAWCRSHPEWRVKVGTPDLCPEGFTPENLPVLPNPPPKKGKPGTELKRILSGFGITETKTCQCAAIATMMDAWGPDECEKHLDGLVAVLSEQATQRAWLKFAPFKALGAKLLLEQAIAAARKRTP